MSPDDAPHRPLHPLNIIAAVAVIVFCGMGMAGIMGWLPNSSGITVQAIDHPKLAASRQLLERTVALASTHGWCPSCGNIESTRGLNTGDTEIRVRLDDGSLRTYQLIKPQWRPGERVNIINGALVAVK